MHSIPLGRVLAIVPVLVTGIIGCGGEKVPSQPVFPANLAFLVQPSTATSGAAISPAIQVAVQDSQGNSVTSSTAHITLAITSGTGTSGAVLGGTLTRAVNGGVATFSDLTIDKAGTGYTLTATTAGLTSAPSNAFSVNPGAPQHLAFAAQPTPTASSEPITPAVQVAVQDAYGNTLTGSTDTVTVALGANPDTASLSGTRTVAAIQGIATFSDLRIDRPGSGYTLVASAPRLTAATSDPFAVMLAFASVSSGTDHTCGITTGGMAYCWGGNSSGELGDGTGNYGVAPVAVVGGLTFTDISADSAYTCGVTTGGAAYCWGENSSGQVGDGTRYQNPSSPVAVLGGLTFAAVSAGWGHACGITIGGAAYCWGANSSGELGDGTDTTRTSPVEVLGGLTFATVSAGPYFNCGTTTGGAGYCWGHNGSGQLGDGSDTSRASPVAVSGGLTFATVSAGGDRIDSHACGVTTGGAAYCWGANTFGQLGDSTGTSHTSPVPVVGGLTFITVSAGALHSCGVTTGGAAYCWGFNDLGQLGDGTTLIRTQPSLVQGGLTFATIDAGDDHTCGVTTGGAAYCWGANRALGTGEYQGPEECTVDGIYHSCSTVPVPVKAE